MKKKGFTLIEIIVVSIILFILLGIGYDFLIRNTRLLTEEKNKAQIESQVKSFLDFVTSSLQTAYQETINVVNEDSIDKLTMMIPNDNSQLDYQGSGTNIKIYYDQLNKSIIVEKGNKTTQLLTGNVEYFTLTKTNNFINIEFKVDYKIRNYFKTYTLNYNIRI